jgi:hypothetical protein
MDSVLFFCFDFFFVLTVSVESTQSPQGQVVDCKVQDQEGLQSVDWQDVCLDKPKWCQDLEVDSVIWMMSEPGHQHLTNGEGQVLS